MTSKVTEDNLLRVLNMYNEQAEALDKSIHNNNILKAKLAEYEKMNFIENSRAVFDIVTNILLNKDTHNLRIKKGREMIS